MKKKKMDFTDHPGFQASQRAIAMSQHLPMERAGAILAAGARKSSAGAKRRNPRLRRVRGQ